jgi:transcriptional regulator with PAS, ATPase and Fis domain
VARAIHQGGPRASGPFVAFNAAAVPETLFESTLFGHRRGAFTGADSAQRGLMEEANGGTLILDEIGDLSQANQAKLLRALETREIRPVGATRPLPVDVRVVACTNADLPALVQEGRYRADLYYRLRGVVLELAPLRDRASDIPELAAHFLRLAKEEYDLEVAGFAPEVMDLFQDYGWPGNVRELRHAVNSAALMAPGGWVTVADLPAELQPGAASDPHAPATRTTDLSLEAAERRAIERALRAAEDNRTAAAKLLGVSRSALYRLLSKHGLG